MSKRFEKMKEETEKHKKEIKMTKQEQIEEMNNIIGNEYKQWLDITGVIPYGTTYYAECLGCAIDSAEALYNAGYRKGNKEKNCWKCIESKRVTSDDYAKLQELFADYQLASEKEIRAHEERTKAFERNMKSVLEIEKENVRKETAKEILNDIHRYNGSLFGTCFHKGHYVSDVRDLVKDIAEEYGVEIKE